MTDQLRRIRKFNFRSQWKKVRESSYSKRAIITTQKRPYFSFFISLGLLITLIILGSVLANLNKKEIPRRTVVKEVETYKIGEVPEIKLQAKIEKKGVIKIVAQTPGIVNTINVNEGDTVSAGTTLVSLSSNYNGANSASIQRQLAFAQYQNANETYGTQKDIIGKQRQLTEKSRENTEELRRITENSLGDTRGSLTYNEDILRRLDESITTLEQNNADGSQTQAILAARAQRGQLLSAVNQIRSGLRQTEYSVNLDKVPYDLANLQKDITLRQLDIQSKALDLGKQAAALQFTLASINESLMYPSTPFEATIQKIHVQTGQSVSPGTVLVTISCLTPKGTAVISVPRNIAYSISKTEPTIFTLNKTSLSLLPTYISTEATNGQLYTVVYTLPESFTDATTNEEYITASVPIGIISSTSEIPYIPIDSVYQNQDEAYVFIVDGTKVKSKKVKLGAVYGRYIQIESGLGKKDQVIITRNVVTGDTIRIIN